MDQCGAEETGNLPEKNLNLVFVVVLREPACHLGLHLGFRLSSRLHPCKGRRDSGPYTLRIPDTHPHAHTHGLSGRQCQDDGTVICWTLCGLGGSGLGGGGVDLVVVEWTWWWSGPGGGGMVGATRESRAQGTCIDKTHVY